MILGLCVTNKIDIDDRVIIVKSPYLFVKRGTIVKVKNIRYNHFGNGRHLYELSDVVHSLFLEHELKIISDFQETK